MDEQRLHDKLDKLVEDVNSVKVELVKQHATLEYHIKRTDLLEDSNKILKDECAVAFTELREAVKPLTTFKDYFTGATKLIAMGLTFLGVATGIVKLFFKKL